MNTFSWSALFVPAWFAFASLLSFLPGWRPGALAVLAGSILPFVPIAVFARVSADPTRFLAELPFLDAAGIPAFGAVCAAISLLLAALVARIALWASRKARISKEFGVRPWLLPPPLGHRDTGMREWTKGFLLDEARPSEPEPSVAGRVPAEDGASDSFDFKVPKLAPLPPLHSLGGFPDETAAVEPKSDTAADRQADGALEQADETAENREDDVEEATALSEISDQPPQAASDAVRVQAAGPKQGVEPSSGPAPASSVVALSGARPIEFITVPPRQAAPHQAAPESDEAAKAAAFERILARREAERKDKPYAVPVDGILSLYPDGQYWIIDDKTRRSAEVLRDTLAEFKIEAEVTGIRKGPVITMFEILPAPGVKLSKIAGLADNIGLRLAASSVRIVAPIPGKHAVGIEVPNERRSIVSLREIVENESFKTTKMELPVILGKDIAGEVQFIDLTQTPHLLIAGATGSGKSVCVNSIILSILYKRSPQEVRLLLIDPKIVELKLYNDIPHLLTPVVTEPKRAFQALQYCICEMERRYSLLDRVGVRDVKSYNRKVREKHLAAERLPYLVVIIDEFADLMATTGKELESTLARLAAMSRAVGIHLVLATQRPSIDVITGLIKANIPSRIAFMVASKFDSRIIIDMVGAEKLLGRGDMLFASAWDPFPVRMQGAFVSEEEVEKAVEYVKTLGEPEYIDDEIFIDEDENEEPSLFADEDDDPLYEKALEIVLQQGRASASFIQRRLKIGYNRASRLVELMEEKGIVGPAKGSKPRDLVHNPEILGRAEANSRAGEGAAARQRSLIPDAETVPGQRVTGKDEAD
jgi:S-DNA-T family DNA segregation ATPase FtsK/SpoIIIE